MNKSETWQSDTSEWKCTLELEEQEDMREEFTLKKVDNGYILSGGGITLVYTSFKNVVKKLEIIFGEGEKKKKLKKRKGA